MTLEQPIDPYPSELQKIKTAGTLLQSRFMGKTFDEPTRKSFEVEARNRFEDVGFVIGLEWEEIEGVHLPQISIVGRVHNTEIEVDHDRVTWEVREGVADGQKGVIRADGTKREDPIRKNIY